MLNPIQLKSIAFTFGGVTVKAVHVIIPCYELVTVTITILLLFLGIYILTKKLSSRDITKMVIGMIALNVTDVLKMETKLAYGFNAFVILILGLMSVRENKEPAENKKI